MESADPDPLAPSPANLTHHRPPAKGLKSPNAIYAYSLRPTPAAQGAGAALRTRGIDACGEAPARRPGQPAAALRCACHAPAKAGPPRPECTLISWRNKLNYLCYFRQVTPSSASRGQC